MGNKARQRGPLAEAIAEELRVRAARLKIGVKDLSERTGMPIATVSKSLAGQRAIDVEELARLSEGLESDPAELLDHAQQAIDTPSNISPIQTGTSRKEPPLTSPSSERERPSLASKLRLLIDVYSEQHDDAVSDTDIIDGANSHGADLTLASWRRLIGGKATPVSTDALVGLARFFDVNEEYLLGSDPDVVDRIHAELEFREALHTTGAQAVAARLLGDVSPDALRAITAAILSTQPDES